MVNSYIATEDFSFLFKGDIITLDNDKYTLSKEDNYSDSNCVSHCSRSISLSKDLVEDYVKSGLLEPVTKDNDSSDKLSQAFCRAYFDRKQAPKTDSSASKLFGNDFNAMKSPLFYYVHFYCGINITI